MVKLIKQATGTKSNPRAIAEVIKEALTDEPEVHKVEVAGAGYLNVFLDRRLFLAESVGSQTGALPVGAKVCVEHTSVNPNKAAHVGHVRNAVLGDTFVRLLKANGKTVEVQNYIDNTGVQVADVVIGFIYLEEMDLAAIKKLDAKLSAAGGSFDLYCWDLYSKVGAAYQNDPDLAAKRAEVLHLIEAGDNETAELADFVANRNVECILATMERFGIRYDLLPRESEILHLHFWDKAFEQMKQLGVVRYEETGNHAGCWVMPFESHSGTDEHESDKILVRSNGTVTYTGKDIAYQMWKLGILGLDFHYRPFHHYRDGHTVWMSSAEASSSDIAAPEFGHGDTVYNVIDTRQSYPQDVVRQGVAAISPERGETASVHLSYEMVALSPAAAAELGFELSDSDRSRPFVEMSGRKGLGVKADDLLDRLEHDALSEVRSRHSDMAADKAELISIQIAVGALRYFLLKFTRNTLIVFDFKEALSFEGETGCFCQYSAVRANSIFKKLEDQGETLDVIREEFRSLVDKDTDDLYQIDDVWALALLSARLEETMLQAADQAEPAILARYAFNLAKSFNLFYHNHKILTQPDRYRRAVLINVADMARQSLTRVLDVMELPCPRRCS
jgi:arginyl-tRNA synthetase